MKIIVPTLYSLFAGCIVLFASFHINICNGISVTEITHSMTNTTKERDEISVQVLVPKKSASLTPCTASYYNMNVNNGIILVTFPQGSKNLQYMTISVHSPDQSDVCDGNFIRQDEIFYCTFDSDIIQPKENVLAVSIFDVLNEVVVLHTNAHVWFDDNEHKKAIALLNQGPKYSFSTFFVSPSENNLARDIKVVVVLSVLSASMYVLYDRYHFTIEDVNAAMDILQRSSGSQISALISDIGSLLRDISIQNYFSSAKPFNHTMGHVRRNHTDSSDSSSGNGSGGSNPNLFHRLQRLQQKHISTPFRTRVFNVCKVCSLLLASRVLSNTAGRVLVGSPPVSETQSSSGYLVAEPIVPPPRQRFAISKSFLYGPRIPLDPTKAIMPAGEYQATRRGARLKSSSGGGSSSSNNNRNNNNNNKRVDNYSDNEMYDQINESSVSIVDAIRLLVSAVITKALSVWRR